MVRLDASQPIFRALADPTRRQIIELLAERPRTIGDIASGFDVTRPAIAKHLRILAEGGLIAVESKGRERINRLNPRALKKAVDWLNHFDRFWDARLAKLKKAVEEKE